MIAVMCSTRNWYVYLATAIYALFKNNEVKKVYLFIEDNNIPYITDKRIEFININKIPRYIKSYSPNYKTKYTLMTLVRCYFSKVLKEDKILYLDVDALVNDNIQELWDLDFEDKVIIGVKEPGEWEKHLEIEGMDNKYINSGIMLMNLKAIREQKLDDKMLALLHQKYYAYPDQDVLNIVCKDKIKYVSNIYNSTETTGIRDDAKIIHYIRERKGWVRESLRSEIWYKYFNEMIGGKMVKVVVTDSFTLGRFGELQNLQRANASKNEYGKLNKNDEFICSDELADYLCGNNGLKKAFVKVIEVIPNEEPKEETKVEKPKKKTSKKK